MSPWHEACLPTSYPCRWPSLHLAPWMLSFSCQFPVSLNDHNMITYDSYVLPVLVLIYITSVDSMSAYQVQILPGGAQIKGSSPCGRRAAKSAKAACLQPFLMITAPQKVTTIIKCHLQTSWSVSSAFEKTSLRMFKDQQTYGFRGIWHLQEFVYRPDYRCRKVSVYDWSGNWYMCISKMSSLSKTWTRKPYIYIYIYLDRWQTIVCVWYNQGLMMFGETGKLWNLGFKSRITWHHSKMST